MIARTAYRIARRAALAASVLPIARVVPALLSAALVSGLATGQNTPGTPSPGTQPANPGQGNQGPQGGTDPQGIISYEPGSDEILLKSAEVDGISLKDFIKTAQIVTGKTFVFSETDLQSAADPKITWVGPKRIKRDNFFPFFQTMLYIKGFATLLRGDKDTELIEIVFMGGTKRTELSASARYVEPDTIKDFANQTGVTILTSVPLKYIDANAAQNSLRPFFMSGASGGQPPVQFGNVGTSQALIMQGFGPQVFAAYQLLRLVDKKPEIVEIDTRIVELVHASAEETVEYIDKIINQRQQQQPAAAAGASGAAMAGQRNEMKILAHSTLNAIVLSGTRDQILEAQSLIAQLDVPVDVIGGDTHIETLKNVLAKDLEDTLDRFIQEDISAEQQAAASGGGQGSVRRPRKTVVVAHEESNSLLISGTATKVKQLRRVIDKLDRRQRQVLIECAVVELTTNDQDSLAVELGLLDIKENGDFTRPFGFTSNGLSTFQDTDDNGLPDLRLPDFENPLSGFTGGIISSGDFAIPILVNALSRNEKANILSVPSVVVNNNQEAAVSSKEQRPTQTINQNANSQQQGAGQPEDAGIDLQISPSISSNNYLRLNINLRVSRFITPFNPNSVVAGVQTIREIKTQVTMPSGMTMVLGGVVEDQESQVEEGIPFLKDIPLLGFLFGSRSSDQRKVNLYFFLTPHILDETDFSDLAELSFRKKLEAAQYIGNRRIQLVDRQWRAGRPETLEDAGASLEDLDRRGGFEIPYYQRPRAERDMPSSAPSSPTDGDNDSNREKIGGDGDGAPGGAGRRARRFGGKR